MHRVTPCCIVTEKKAWLLGVCHDTDFVSCREKTWPLEESCHDTINYIVTGEQESRSLG